MKKKMRIIIPLALMIIMYGWMPELVQMINTERLQSQASEIVTPTSDHTQNTYEQVKEKEVSIDSFPKQKTDLDDTERIQRAVDYCIKNDKDLFFPYGGSYVLRSVDVEAGLRLVGYGATFTLAEDQPKFTRMFTTQNRPWKDAEDSAYLIFEGITFDGNVWNQGAFLNSEKEQQFAILLSGSTEKKGMLRAKVIKCRFQNWSGDGVHVYKNADVAITDCSAINCFRGGIVASGAPSNITVTNYVAEKGQFGKAMDIEIDTKPSAKTNLTIDSMLAYGGVDLGTQDGSVVTVENMTVIGGNTIVYGFKNKVTINNSVLGGLKVMNATDTKVNNTAIVVTPSKTEDVNGALVTVVETFDKIPKQDYYTEFNNCTFERSDNTAPIETKKEVNALKGYFGQLIVTDCTIGKGFTHGFYNFGVAYSYLNNVFFDSDNAIVMQPLSWARIYRVELDDVRYGDNNRSTFDFLDYTETKPYTIVALRNMVLDSSKAGYIADKTLGTTIIDSSRIIYVDADPTLTDVPGFVGDTAKLYTAVEGKPSEWKAVKSDPIAAEWEKIE